MFSLNRLDYNNYQDVINGFVNRYFKEKPKSIFIDNEFNKFIITPFGVLLMNPKSKELLEIYSIYGDNDKEVLNELKVKEKNNELDLYHFLIDNRRTLKYFLK